MSRSMTPPSSLTKENIRTIADVRREIWTNAFYGLGSESFLGFAGHSVASLGNRRGIWNIPVSRNTAFLSFFLGGAMGSFIMATTTGKNEVHNLHPIYGIGSRPPPNTSDQDTLSYQNSLQRAKDREILLRQLERKRTMGELVDENDTPETGEKLSRQRSRLYRRATLTRALEENPQLGEMQDTRWPSKDDR